MNDADERKIKSTLSQVGARQIVMEVALVVLIRRLLKTANDPEGELRSYLSEVTEKAKETAAQLGSESPAVEPLFTSAAQEFVRLMGLSLPEAERTRKMN